MKFLRDCIANDGIKEGVRFFLAFLALLLTCCGALNADQIAALPGVAHGATISGRLVDERGNPVASAAVFLSGPGDRQLESLVYTSSGGSFVFTSVPPGAYYLRANAEGFAQAFFGSSEPGQPVPKLNLAADQIKSDVVLHARKLCWISGVIYDSEGEPAPNAQVALLMTSYARMKPGYSMAGSATTNGRGEYSISTFAGKYRVYAMSNMQASAASSEAVYGQPQVRQRLAPRYYPDTDNIAHATALSLSPGNRVQGIDIHLPFVLVSHLKGHVTLPPGFPDDVPVQIALVSTGSGQQPQVGAGIAVAPAREFYIENVLSGDYTLVADAFAKGVQYRVTRQVSVGREDNVDVPIVPPVKLSGTLTLEGADLRTSGSFRVSLTSGDELYAPPIDAEVNPDGAFQFAQVPAGIWDIGPSPIPPGWYLKAMYLGDKDVLTDDMVITPTTRERLRIVISTRSAALSGTVEDNGAPAGAVVLLAPDGRFSNTLSFYNVAGADPDGTFKMSGATPGKYKLFAFDRMDPGAYYNPDFLPPFAAQGTSIELREGDQITTKLTLIHTKP